MMMTPNNIPQGYKATSLGIIPQEWEVRRFRDVGNFLRNNTLSRDKMSESDGCVQNIHYGDVLIKYREILNVSRTNIPWIVENSKDSSLGDMLQDGDIVISDTAEDYTVGKATELLEINGASVVAGLHTMPFRPLANLFSPCFLGYYINSMAYRFQLYALIQGIKVCAISKKAMSSTFLIVPPLAEQKKIAKVLGVWDKAIEKQSQLIEQLTLRKRGLMQQLLTAKRRLPGFSEPWKKVKLGDIGNTYNGLSGKNKDDFEYGNAQFIPYINVFSNERIDTNNLGCVQIKPNEQQNTVKYGDIFFTVSSETPDEVGMASVLLEHLDNTYLNSFCFGYRLNNFSTLNPFFAAYLFRTEHFRNYMSVLAQGSTRFNISKKEVMKLKIDLPTIEEQTAIAEVLTAADREIELAKEKLERLRRQKRGLMQQLLTGKKRIKI